LSYGITSEGFSRPTLQEIREELTNKLLTDYPDLVLGPEELLYNLIGYSAESFDIIWQTMEAVYQAHLPSTSYGVSQDLLYQLNNLSRYSARKSRLENFEVSGSISTLIPAGFKVSAATLPGYQFELLEDVTIVSSPQKVTMYCTVTGAVDPGAGTVTTIDTPISGVTAVTNPQATVIGRDVESDSEFYLRRGFTIATSNVGTNPGIKNAILGLNDDETKDLLEYIQVYSNDTSSVDSRGRSPHSVEAVVLDVATTTSVVNSVPTVLTATCTNNNSVLVLTGTPANLVIGDTLRVGSDYDSQSYEYFTVVNISSSLVYLNDKYKGSTSSGESLDVYTGREKEIAAALLASKCSGIQTWGAMCINATNDEDQTKVMRFNVPQAADIHLSATLTVTSSLTIEEIANLKSTIAAWGNTLGVGQDVIVFGYNCLVAQFNNPKITDVAIDIGKGSLSGTDNNVSISDGSTTPAEYSSWSVTNIAIT